jgi:hypothetical protein
MTYWETYKALRKHLKLSEKRNVALVQNKSAKYTIYFMSGFMIIYLMFLAVMFSLIINGSSRITGYEFMYGISPFILAVGFLLRFATQHTPSQLIKPYVLLPIPHYRCVDTFLIRQLQNSYNFLGFAIFAPFALMSVVFSEGLLATFGFLLGLYLLVLFNSQWYLLVRSLVSTHMAWWALPLAVYALIFSPLFTEYSPLTWMQKPGITTFCDFYAQLGEGFTFWHLPYYIGIICLLALLFRINRGMQYKLIWQELGKTSSAEKASKLRFTALSRFGEIGEYLKLEVKSIMRNKNIKKAFISSNVLVIVLSLLLSFTDVYASEFMNDFWCIYCFSIYGSMLLSKVMCYEGNYIECLMVNKENIYLLLRSKYYFYSLLLIFPMLLMIPTLFTEVCTPLQLLSYAVFTGGVSYCLFFQMAIINKQTMPLNTKFIGKGSMENNWLQVVVQLFIFFFPLLFIRILQLFFPKTIAYLVILITGLLFMATHQWWLKNVYKRMMLRRYENLEGFRASRD